MAKYEFAIACRDEDGNSRKKEGDIIAVQPAPWQWGNIEIKRYLIVVIDNLTEEDVTFMTTPFYENGVLNPAPEDKVSIIAKRRCNIPLWIIQEGWYPDLDLNKVRNIEEVYQPLKDNNIVIDAQEPVAIAQDKLTESFKYNAIRTI